MDARDLEVRCESCDAGFAAGTRECVHCGRRLPRRSTHSGQGLRDDPRAAEWFELFDLGAPNADGEDANARGESAATGGPNGWASPPARPSRSQGPAQARQAPARRDSPGSSNPPAADDRGLPGGLIANLLPSALVVFFVIASFLVRACSGG